MTISADALLTYILVAFGGFLVKAIWDQMVKKGQETQQKAASFDKAEMAEFIKATMMDNMNYFQKKYNEAVDHLALVEKDFLALREQNLAFYRYQLINTCKKYLAQGEITQYQFDRLTELHKIYHSLGGNSQGDLYYQKALKLPIAKEREHLAVNHEDDELYVTADDLKADHHEAGRDIPALSHIDVYEKDDN